MMFSISPKNQESIKRMLALGHEVDISMGKVIRCTIWETDPRTGDGRTLCNGVRGETVDEVVGNAVVEVGL